MNKTPTLILASNSPRRRELLALGGWTFHLDVADINEDVRPGEEPAAYVERLAMEKAQAVLPRSRPGQVILGADTTVVLDGEILGKPADPAEARAMLTRLRGREHQVYTGIAVLRASDQTLHSEVCLTQVPMRDYSDAEMDAYIASDDPLDKAGAYGIQNLDFQPVINMRGCYASVMGLPLCHLTVLLRQLDIHPQTDLPKNCQAALNYDCPVFRSILER
ncbi:MAG: Maf family protein [Anaerolineales bacterium]